jgi:predicted restriction endonuclease
MHIREEPFGLSLLMENKLNPQSPLYKKIMAQFDCQDYPGSDRPPHGYPGQEGPVDMRDTWNRRIYRRDGNKCSMCGSQENLHAHHVKPVKTNPELKCSIENGITLCKNCHMIAHRIISADGGLTCQGGRQ